MSTMLRRYKQVALALSFGCVALTAQAESVEHYPSSSVTMIVGWAAGGPADGVGRMVAAEMGKHLGQAIVVDNKGGGEGQTGWLYDYVGDRCIAWIEFRAVRQYRV